LKTEFLDPKTNSGVLLQRLREVQQNMKNKNNKYTELLNPKELFKFLNWSKRFPIGFPHDAHEAFLYLVEVLKCKDFKGDVLEIMYTTEKPIEQIVKKNNINSLEIPLDDPDFEKCIDNYFQTEFIQDWKDKDGNTRELVKSMKICNLPIKLAFVARQNILRKKKISFPLEIDMNKYCVINSSFLKYKIYQIYAVVVHTGTHYYTYILHDNQEWVLYDDESITHNVSTKTVMSEAPYMIVYKPKI
tara:strand:+ start:136 stop:870 length:735 start_codon:yes stop_codon:yes gene_type:complete